MKLDKFKSIVESTSPTQKKLISRNMDILERIHELLEIKYKGKQSLLAAAMGKKESEISRLFSGFQNYTMKTIIKLEIAFDAPILHVITGKTNRNAKNIRKKSTH